MIARTASGAAVRLGDEVARGGEAVIRTVVGDSRLLAKVFSADRTAMEDKLRAMRDHPPADPAGVPGHSAIAWPRELLYDDGRRLIGFLMPHVREAVPILDVLNPRRRAATMPAFDLAYLHRCARNLASALHALHATRVIVGDLNERNILVTPRALVTLIDADSFQIQRLRQAEIVFYPCPVGRAEYTPPELQGQPFRDAVRLPEHDAFGLSVLIFQLLMAGSHPFRSAWLGSGEAPPLEEKIRRGWFPYLDRPSGPVAPPPRSARIGQLHPALVDAFAAAFVRGHTDPRQRPTAETWARRLEDAEAHLTTCGNGHVFADHLDACPTCDARRRGAGWPARRRAPAERIRAPGPPGRAPRTAVQPMTAAAVRTPMVAPRREPSTVVLRARAAAGKVARVLRRALAAPAAPTGSSVRARVAARVRRAAHAMAVAVAAAIGSAAAAVAVAVLVPNVGAAGDGAAGSALWSFASGWLSGGAALAVGVTLREVARPSKATGGHAATVGQALAENGIGWTLGWAGVVLTAAVVDLGLRGLGAEAAALASTPPLVGALAVAWTVGWAVYGAVGGSVGQSGDEQTPARAIAVYAAVGCVVAFGLRWIVAVLG